MQGKRAMLLAGVGALAALMGGVPAQAQVAAQPAVWGDRTGFDDYDWIDRADAISEAVGESPPDTSFAFEQGEPWAWTLEDGSVLLVEQLADGPHGYYFEAGSDVPFLVRDPAMSFGFVDGAVAIVYGADGEALSREDGRSWLGAAMRGYERGRRLKRAMAQRDRQRSMNVGAWYDMSYLLFDWWDDWDYGLLRNPRWRRHHDGPRGTEHRRRWEHERQRRQVIHNLFERWSQGGYRGPAPGRFAQPKPGTPPPPHRGDWHGRGRDGHGDRQGHGERRPRDPRVEGASPPDLSVNPVQGSGRPQGAGSARPPRTGGPGGGYRPRPEPQAPAVQVPQAAAPVEQAPPTPAVDRPARMPRPDRDTGGRARQPRPMPETSDDDAPPRPVYSAPRPMRSERPSYTPAPAPARSFTPTPAPAPTRSYTPSPAPAPARSYTPSPSPAPTRSYTPSPSPAPSRSYSPSPSPAPSRSYSPSPSPAPSRSSTPSPAPSRSDPPAVRAKQD